MSLELAYKVKGYRFDLSEGKFRYRLDPQEDELLSSWLIRTALFHLTEPSTFVNLYLPRWRNVLWARDVDVWADKDLLETLSLKSGIAYETLYNLTLRSYEGYLAETITPKTRNPFIQFLKNCSRMKVGYGLRFCPECLRSDETPYFRKKWRLSFSTA
ncbi:MAG: TniQ family protein [Nitrospirae bacterium]|nr:TniQ family protein [Nitrospirota bacterium]